MRTSRVIHKTCYSYGNPVALCHNEAHLTPRALPGQQCRGTQLTISPRPAALRERRDFFGNHVTYFAIQEPHTTLEVTATTELELDDNPRVCHSPVTWDEARDLLKSDTSREVLEARAFALESPMIPLLPALEDYARASFSPNRPLVQAAADLNHRIYTEFTYDTHFTTVATPLIDVLEHRKGVCQDFAHLAVGCLRSLGLPARYVSGYLERRPIPGKPRLVGADASHAWASVYIPDFGWIDFDPTNDHFPTSCHIVVAWGRDYGDVTPLKGVILGGGEHTLNVSVDVAPIE